jgi:large subunit ribosomal protein L10
LNREQKAAVIDEIAAEIQEADAIYAVDYRGISVPAAAELRTKLREADASFRIVKNTLTERAADKAEITALKELLQGPTALTFVRGDVALAAKAISDQAKITETLEFKGGFMNGAALSPDEIRSIARLPARDVLYQQLVGMVASPITGLARGLNALIGGLAIALGQVQEKKQSGEIPSGDAPEAPAAEADQDAEPPTEGETPHTEEPAEGADDDTAPEA